MWRITALFFGMCLLLAWSWCARRCHMACPAAAPLLPWLRASPTPLAPRSPRSKTAAAGQAAHAIGWATRRALVEPAAANATTAALHPAHLAAWLTDLTAGGPDQALIAVKFGLNMDHSPSRTFTGRAWVQFEKALSAAFPGTWRARPGCGTAASGRPTQRRQGVPAADCAPPWPPICRRTVPGAGAARQPRPADSRHRCVWRDRAPRRRRGAAAAADHARPAARGAAYEHLGHPPNLHHFTHPG